MPGLVLSPREQLPPSFAKWCLVGEGLRPRQDVAVVSRLQGGVDLGLFGLEPQLIEPPGLDPSRVPLLELEERAPLPECEGLPEQVGRPLGLLQREHLAPSRDEPLEALGVDLVGRDAEAVPLR